jgi:hypothetical protein
MHTDHPPLAVAYERTARALVLRVITDLRWRDLEDERLLALAGQALPYNLRPTVAGDALAMMVSVVPVDEVETRRAKWLETEVVRAAAAVSAQRAYEMRAISFPPLSSDEIADAPAGSWGAVGEAVQWIAASKGWKPAEATSPSLRYTIPGEIDLPPLVVTVREEGVLVERPVPVLPARNAGAEVRAATVHAVLRLNATMLCARVAVRDAAALVAVVESQLPADEADEDEIECALESVRNGTRRATVVLECLRNPAVAADYAIAHDLPVATGVREPRRSPSE